MARIRFGDLTLAAEPISQLDDGYWLMEVRTHGAHIPTGIQLRVKQREIIEMAAAEMPARRTMP